MGSTLDPGGCVTAKVVPLQLCFKGERDYLQGADIYQGVVDAIRNELREPAGGIRMAIRRFFARQPDLLWMDSPEASARPQQAVVDYTVDLPARRSGGWLVESGRPVECRLPFDEARIALQCVFSDRTVEVTGELGFLPIEVVVAMTKQLHQRKLPSPAGRWIFTRIDLRRLLRQSDAAALSVTLEENLHNRLTRSSIVAGGEAIGSIYFSLIEP